MKRLFFLMPSLVLAFAVVCGVFGCTNKAPKYLKISGERFHTYYHITYEGNVSYDQQIDSVFDVFNHSANPFDSTSILSAVNANKHNEIDEHLHTIISRAFEISDASQGSYDVTCSPLINAWGFGFDKTLSMDSMVVDSLKQFVGYQKVKLLDNKLIKADLRMKLDLSSISKGYCTDLVGAELKRLGSPNYLVEIGGEIVYHGVNPEGQSWHVGINKPIDDSTGLVQDIEVVVKLQGDGGLATSGNYRNFKVVDGRRIAHTIDPISGYPIQTDVLSATVIAPDCMTADGLATAMMVVGSARVPELVANFPKVEYMLILGADDGKGFRTVMSKGFEALIQ